MKATATLLLAAFTLAAGIAEGNSATLLTTPGLGVDQVLWAQLGTPRTALYGPQNIVTIDGLAGVVSSAGGLLFRIDQDPGDWNGNFLPGLPLLETTSGSGPDITISIPHGVAAFGEYIQANIWGPFQAEITAFDSSNHIIGSFTEDGQSDHNVTPAIFLGIQSDTADITSIRFELTSSANSNLNDFAIAGAIPEPSTWILLLLGFASLGFVGHYHPSSHRLTALYFCEATIFVGRLGWHTSGSAESSDDLEIGP